MQLSSKSPVTIRPCVEQFHFRHCSATRSHKICPANIHLSTENDSPCPCRLLPGMRMYLLLAAGEHFSLSPSSTSFYPITNEMRSPVRASLRYTTFGGRIDCGSFDAVSRSPFSSLCGFPVRVLLETLANFAVNQLRTGKYLFCLWQFEETTLLYFYAFSGILVEFHTFS